MNRNDGVVGDARKRAADFEQALDQTRTEYREALDRLGGDESIRADERERIAEAIERRNVEQHGAGCLCLVCESFTYAARLVRQATR